MSTSSSSVEVTGNIIVVHGAWDGHRPEPKQCMDCGTVTVWSSKGSVFRHWDTYAVLCEQETQDDIGADARAIQAP